MRKTIRARTILSAGAIVAAASAGPAFAGGPVGPKTSGFYYGSEASAEFYYFLEEEWFDNSQPLVFAESVPPYGSFSGMSHVAGAGVNKARMNVNLASTVDDELTAAHAQSFADWYDQITISDPILNGTTGTFTATMLVNGSGTMSAAGPWVGDEEVYMFGSWAAWVGVSEDGIDYVEDGWAGGWENNPATGQFEYDGDPLGQMQTAVEFEFTFGEPFYLEGRLQSFFFIDNLWGAPGTLEATVDLGNSAYWGGIEQVRDANGNVVARPSITSASGVGWGASIDPGVLRGDFDRNDAVNVADFGILASHFNEAVTTWTNGDATGDGVVGIRDFAILAANFNQQVGRPAAVPEPASAAGVMMFTAATILPRRRRG